MSEADLSKSRERAGGSPARFRAKVGLALGFVLGLLLALAEVTVAVRFENNPGQSLRYRVLVLGIVVFRYPEDGELYRMRPYPQAIAARQQLVLASALAGGLIGWVTGYGSGRRTGRGGAPILKRPR